MREALRCVATYLLALLVTLLVGASWLLDSPSETETARLVELIVIDRAAELIASKDQP